MTFRLDGSAALWNRSRLDLGSDEILAQVLERGEIEAWRELYSLAKGDPGLRRRLLAVIRKVPLDFPGFWLAALASQGEDVDFDMELPQDVGIA